MPRKHTKLAKQAHALLVWLETLGLPARVINALRRDLEVITGEREGEGSAGVLAGFDQARFTEELYQPRGGQVGKVPTVAKDAISTLRAAISAPFSSGTVKVMQPAEMDATSEMAEEAHGNKAGTEGAEIIQENLPEEPTVPPAAPKRRGRPPHAPAVEAPAEPVQSPESSVKRRGRSPRDEASAGLPQRTRRARVAAASASQQAALLAEAPAPALAVSAVPSDPSFVVLLRLWSELHPQGQRAAMQYMADLLKSS